MRVLMGCGLPFFCAVRRGPAQSERVLAQGDRYKVPRRRVRHKMAAPAHFLRSIDQIKDRRLRQAAPDLSFRSGVKATSGDIDLVRQKAICYQ